MSQQSKKQAKQFDEYESGNGPRPPVPGEESQMSKTTTEGFATAAAAASISTTIAAAANRLPQPPPQPPSQSPQPSTDSFGTRVKRWQNNLECLLADEEGLNLLFTFVRDDAGENSKEMKQLNFYFACEGLKVINDMQKVRKVTRLISDRYLANNIIFDEETTYELRRTILQISRNEIEPIPHIFDELQKKVERMIEKNIHPAFCKSDIFIQFCNQNNEEELAAAVKLTNTSAAQTSSSGAVMQNMVASRPLACISDGGAGLSAATTYNRPNVDLVSSLINPSNLQTLHEDSELKLNTESHSTKARTDRPTPKLTKDLLLATQKGRLEVRPQGAHGYTYSVSASNSSYNPVSRQDSERQSCSSAGQTSDSEVNSKDGRPYMHRKPTPAEDYRKAHLNPQVSSQKTAIKPLSQGLKKSVQPILASKATDGTSYSLNYNELLEKLNVLKKEQDDQQEKQNFIHILSTKLNSAEPRVDDVDDQSILDQHVSSVFSPRHTPGTTSPKHLQRQTYRTNEMSTSMPDFAQPLRHSRSIPDHASTGLSSNIQHTAYRAHNRSSQNIDRGISLYSADFRYSHKTKEMKQTDRFSDETMRRSSKDDSRRTRKQIPLQLPQLPLLSHQSTNLMPAPSSSSSHLHTNSLGRQPEINEMQEYTTAFYYFGDDPIPYQIKIPGKKVTLRLFKEFTPKRVNFRNCRYFFQTTCNDQEVKDEVVNDSDTVPKHEGKVKGTLIPITE